MNGFVLDCSIAVTWCFEDQAAPETDALLDRVREGGAVVPAIWHLELGNVLLQAERRGRLSAAAVAMRIAPVADLPIATDGETASRALGEVISLARSQDLTTYDASYLELSIRRSFPLATKDRALRKAAHHVGVEAIPG